MADLSTTPLDKNNLSMTGINKTSNDLTWDSITGTWDEHSADTWDSPRQGFTKTDKINLTMTPRDKN